MDNVCAKKSNLDLLIVLGLTVITVPLVALTSGIPRAILGVAFIAFIPGYVFISALFPGSKSINAIERLVLSIGSSLALVAIMGVILNFTPFGIRLWPFMICMVIFIIIMAAVAWVRRRRLAGSPSP